MQIVFRQVDEGYSVPGVHWNIEAFSGDPHERMFPIGCAFVVAASGVAQVKFIMVADHWRRQGVATKLIEACRSHWPGIKYIGAMDERAAGLLGKFATDEDNI